METKDVPVFGTGTLAKAFATLSLIGLGTVSGTVGGTEGSAARERRPIFPTVSSTRTSISKKKKSEWEAIAAFDPIEAIFDPVTELGEPMNSSRPDTPAEEVIGKLRTWALLSSDWDGEGAAAPVKNSISRAVTFVRLLDSNYYEPDPMLHASGRAGLYWNEDDLYADLEFTGSNSVTYFIKRAGKKYKGVASFQNSVPPVFRELLRITI